MTIQIIIPSPSDVMAEMNKKKITMYRVKVGTGLSGETVSRFFNDKRVSVRSIMLITDFVNKY